MGGLKILHENAVSRNPAGRRRGPTDIGGSIYSCSSRDAFLAMVVFLKDFTLL